jgi:hypothetical protein
MIPNDNQFANQNLFNLPNQTNESFNQLPPPPLLMFNNDGDMNGDISHLADLGGNNLKVVILILYV